MTSAFSMKPIASPSSSSNSLKLKTIVQTFISSQVTKAKSCLVYFFRDIHFKFKNVKRRRKKKKKKKQTLFFGSFRLHYNWCSSSSSSHVNNLLSQESYYNYCDPSWDYVINAPTPALLVSSPSPWDANNHDVLQEDDPDELLRYLEWLDEEKKGKIENSGHHDEIDKLADEFIANCYDRFRLEKEDSYRRFQEMMARSI